jgi:hypothetical protein
VTEDKNQVGTNTARTHKPATLKTNKMRLRNQIKSAAPQPNKGVVNFIFL